MTLPTCTSEGYTTYTCSLYDDSYIADKTEKGSHTPKTVPGYAATCTKAGLTDGEKCSACGTILTAQTIIPIADHVYGEWSVTKEPTYQHEGEKTAVCTGCGAPTPK